MSKPLMAPSLMCMDPMNVERDVKVMDEHFDLYHVDVMDSHFCPNMALTPQFANTLRKHSKLPMDVHLMVEDPVMFTEMFQLGAEDCLSYQAETVERNAFRLYERTRELGVKFGIVLSPMTPLANIETICERIDILTIMSIDTGFAGQKVIPETLAKIEAAKKLREERGCHFKIQIDGGIKQATFKMFNDAGADILIVGNSGLFSLDESLPAAIDKYKANFKAETGIELGQAEPSSEEEVCLRRAS